MSGKDFGVSTVPNNSFKVELDTVLGAELTPDTIGIYINTALYGVMDIAHRASDSYILGGGELPKTNKELEDKAFEYYGLVGIDVILGNLAIKADEVVVLEEFVESIPISDEIITPTDPTVIDLQGDGETVLEEKAIIPRLETILFVLQNNFEVDIFNKKELGIIRGDTDPRSFRRRGYDYIQIPSKDRIILSCDEEDNATFVFVTSILEACGVGREDVRKLKKSELKELIETFPGIGKRIIYSNNFIVNLANAVEKIEPNAKSTEPSTGDSDARYLYPLADDEVLSVNGMVGSFGLGHSSLITIAINALGDSLGEVRTYRFGMRSVPGYDANQQMMIVEFICDKGYLDKAPDSVESISGITKSFLAKGLVISPQSVRKAVEELRDSLGETKEYVFGPKMTEGFDEKQRWMILDKLYNKGLIAPAPPEGMMSLFDAATYFGVDLRIAKRAVENAAMLLGQVDKYKFGSHVSVGLNPAQLLILRDFLG